MKKISVCVPTYNRPDTLRQLINSFLKQTYPEKELIISDDSPNNSIEQLVKEYRNKNIKYFHNPLGLGFSRNFLRALERATGEYLLTLGDDDILLHQNVLLEYVRVFDTNPSVGFIYSNMLQFSDSLQIETVIDFSSKNKLFKKGKESMEHMWFRSIFIGGIGIRNSKGITRFYPKKKILHPQVEFIGNILNRYDTYLLAKTNIGFRSHNDQIIFRALKNKYIRQDGEHMTVELYNIFNMLNNKYKLQMNFDFVAQELMRQQKIMMFKEKINLGSKEMEKNYRKFCSLSDSVNGSREFKIAFLMAKTLPNNAITFARYMVLKLITIGNKKTHDVYKKQLDSIISE